MRIRSVKEYGLTLAATADPKEALPGEKNGPIEPSPPTGFRSNKVLLWPPKRVAVAFAPVGTVALKNSLKPPVVVKPISLNKISTV
jgi:hypothetical protein